MHYSDFKLKPHNWGLPESEIWRRYQLFMEQEMFKNLTLQIMEAEGRGSSSSSASAGGGAAVVGGPVLILDAANPLSYPGSGTDWYDLSTYGNNAQLVNGPTISGSGDQRIIVFDPTNDYYQVPANPSLDCIKGVSAFALCKVQDVAIKQVIMKNNDEITTNISYGFQFWNDGYVYFNLRTSSGWREIADPSEYSANTWYYYGMTYDGKTLRGYRNGVNVVSASWSGDVRLNPFGIQNSTGAATGSVTQLSLSRIEIYDRALTDYEINQNFQAIRGRFGL